MCVSVIWKNIRIPEHYIIIMQHVTNFIKLRRTRCSIKVSQYAYMILFTGFKYGTKYTNTHDIFLILFITGTDIDDINK